MIAHVGNAPVAAAVAAAAKSVASCNDRLLGVAELDSATPLYYTTPAELSHAFQKGPMSETQNQLNE